MRTLFFGTAEFAVPSLEALAESRHDVIAVVTQPDKPQGRGLKVSYSPVKVCALRLGLSVLQPRRVRSESFLNVAREMKPDVLALAAFGQIIPQSLLDLPPKGPINVHGSLLPAYRGAAPIQRAILSGESITGISTMWMDATLDTGDILLKREIAIDPADTAGSLIPKMAAMGAELLLETLSRLESGNCPRIPQDLTLATFAPALTSADSAIQWEVSAIDIRNRVRALSPRPGTFAAFRGRRIKVWTTGVRLEENGTPGVVFSIDRQSVSVGTGMGTVELMEVQPENSRRMTGAEWARGARVVPGDRFDIG